MFFAIVYPTLRTIHLLIDKLLLVNINKLQEKQYAVHASLLFSHDYTRSVSVFV